VSLSPSVIYFIVNKLLSHTHSLSRKTQMRSPYLGSHKRDWSSSSFNPSGHSRGSTMAHQGSPADSSTRPPAKLNTPIKVGRVASHKKPLLLTTSGPSVRGRSDASANSRAGCNGRDARHTNDVMPSFCASVLRSQGFPKGNLTPPPPWHPLQEASSPLEF
jgi:hypothetical protein